MRDGALFRKEALWVPSNNDLLVELIREVHDQPAVGHLGVRRTVEQIGRQFYWPAMRKTVDQYVRNCYTCQRSKAPRDKSNGLLQHLELPEQRWRDIAMDFVTGLPLSNGFNAILTVIDRLTKERHYIPCSTEEEGTTTEATVELLINWVFRTHGLPSSIVSDRGPQFISMVWRSLCKRLGITLRLSTAYHPETDGQSERANQDVERYLRAFCSYMQDDWTKWLPMAEFADNNAVSSATSMTPFFLNKGFHPRMSFGPDDTDYTSTRERLQARKAEDISDQMAKTLDIAKQALQKARAGMINQVNKHRKEVSYEPGSMVFLDGRNIETVRPSKKLDDKMLGPFKVIERVGSAYRLELPATMRVHDVFHPKLLRLAATDPLPGQKVEPPGPIMVEGEDEWEVDDILDSRIRYRKLQYRVKWKDSDTDLTWYDAHDGQFDNAKEVVDEFHRRYPAKPGP